MTLLLLFACATPSTPAPTWSADVRPMVHARCAGCHHQGGSAAFALDTWEAMTPHVGAALAAMESGSMPPWPADPACRHYEDERLLGDGELAMFRAWVEAGAPQGDATDDAPFVVPVSGFAPTDAAAVPGYVPSTEEADDWRCFVLSELTSPEARYLHGTQVVPASPLVHHVLVYALPGTEATPLAEADAAEEGPGYTCFGGPTPGTEGGSSGTIDTVAGGFPNQIAGWVPGSQPIELPEDVSIRVDAESIVVMQVHYHTTGATPEPDTTELQLEMDTAPTPWLSVTRPLAVVDFEIPAGSPEVTASLAYPNYGDPIELRTVMAHMHLLGERQTVEVLHADGDSTCVLDIPEWDFDWQQTYTLLPEAPVTVATGDALALTCTWDNSAANQPVEGGVQQEPRDVTWGESSNDEMCLAYTSKIEPWTEPADPAALACAGTEACVAACGDAPTLDCVLSCPEADFDCFVCTLQGAAECGATACVAELTAARDCLSTCAGSGVMLDSNVGACLTAECPAEYAAIQSCVDPILTTEACAAPLAACGVG